MVDRAGTVARVMIMDLFMWLATSRRRQALSRFIYNGRRANSGRVLAVVELNYLLISNPLSVTYYTIVVRAQLCCITFADCDAQAQPELDS